MGLVSQVAKYLSEHEQTPLTLDIVHLMGQHFDYAKRYPHQQAHFTIKDYASKGKSRQVSQVIMHYDNATRYNDMVVDSLLRLYEQQDAVVIYVADHGEEVYDDLQMSGRLFQQPTLQIARQEFEVPLWIWCSQKYLQSHPDASLQFHKSCKRAFITSDMSQLLFHLAGIKSKWYDVRRDILSPIYKSSPRIIGGATDYDSLLP